MMIMMIMIVVIKDKNLLELVSIKCASFLSLVFHDFMFLKGCVDYYNLHRYLLMCIDAYNLKVMSIDGYCLYDSFLDV